MASEPTIDVEVTVEERRTYNGTVRLSQKEYDQLVKQSHRDYCHGCNSVEDYFLDVRKHLVDWEVEWLGVERKQTPPDAGREEGEDG